MGRGGRHDDVLHTLSRVGGAKGTCFTHAQAILQPYQLKSIEWGVAGG